MPDPFALHRLAFKTAQSELHLYRCAECGAEPIVTLDEERRVIKQCRYHPGAELESK